MNPHHRELPPCLLRCAMACAQITLIGQIASAQLSRRAPHPDWAQQDVSGIFFDDALKEGLRGERPQSLGPADSTDSTPPHALAPATFGWSRLIDSATIEDTIKSLRYQLDSSVQQPAQFAAGGAADARRQFAVLACLFAIVHEYDGPVRWKRDALAARDRCQAAAEAAQRADRPSFQLAQQTKEQIADLILGNGWAASGETPQKRWDQIADRRALMLQLDVSMKTTLQPASSNIVAFHDQSSALFRESQLTSAIVEILTRDEMDDASEDDYVEYCRRIQAAAQSIIESIRSDDGDAARRAVGSIHKSCTACHEDFRG